MKKVVAKKVVKKPSINWVGVGLVVMILLMMTVVLINLSRSLDTRSDARGKQFQPPYPPKQILKQPPEFEPHETTRTPNKVNPVWIKPTGMPNSGSMRGGLGATRVPTKQVQPSPLPTRGGR